MRSRPRDQAGEAARRRLRLLEAELAGLRPGSDLATGSDLEPAPGHPPGHGPDPGPGPADRFEAPEAIAAGPPGLLGSGRDVLYAPRGRPLPAAPTAVPAPGRHAVPRRGGGVPDWVEDRVPPRWRARIALNGQHLTLLVASLVVVLLVTGWLTLRRDHVTPVPAARFVTAASPSSGASPAPRADASATTGAAPAGRDVVVDVAGKVRRPGVVTLPSGSRVQDAIARAGGMRPGVAAGSLNLARVLVDGEQVLVGMPVAAGAAPALVAGTTAPEGGLVNLNSSSLTQLEDLPGVGPVTAQKILDYRTDHGAFTAVDQLLEVDGIGDKTLADIAPHATL